MYNSADSDAPTLLQAQTLARARMRANIDHAVIRIDEY